MPMPLPMLFYLSNIIIPQKSYVITCPCYFCYICLHACNPIAVQVFTSGNAHAYWVVAVKYFFQFCYKSLHGRTERLGQKLFQAVPWIFTWMNCKNFCNKKPSTWGLEGIFLLGLYVKAPVSYVFNYLDYLYYMQVGHVIFNAFL